MRLALFQLRLVWRLPLCATWVLPTPPLRCARPSYYSPRQVAEAASGQSGKGKPRNQRDQLGLSLAGGPALPGIPDTTVSSACLVKHV